MKYITGICTDIGVSRKVNQDALAVIHAVSGSGNICMVIICDGMGGLSKGEFASAVLIKTFERYFERRLPELLRNCDLIQISEFWKEELIKWNKKLREYGEKQQIKLGTTFSGMLFIGEHYFWVHVGDSRIYQISSTSVRQISTDHTVTAREIANGTMTREEAEHCSQKHKLTQCIGASRQLEPQTGIGSIKVGESFLICSDGFYHMFSESEMMEISKKGYCTNEELDRFCQSAIAKVIQRGEKDNISVICLKYI